jgi:TPR repeat protein
MRALLLFVLAFVSAAGARSADIGGWMEQQSRVALVKDDCPQLLQQAARTPSSADNAAQLFYASGLCYLYSAKLTRDTVAAGAWFTKAAELNHPQARRALLALREPAEPHPSAAHCHDLGLGRELCHGGASSQ